MKLLAPTRTHRFARLGLALAALTLTAAPLLATAANAAPVSSAETGTPAGDAIGYNNVIGSVGVFSHYMNINGTKVIVYCLVQPLKYQASGIYTATNASASAVSNVAVADDIAANSQKIGTPLTVPAEEAVAVQLAIWNATTGFNIYQVNNATITTRAAQLIAGDAVSTQGSLGAALHVTHYSSYAGTTVRVILTTTNGSPIAGATIAVTAGVKRNYTTNAAGVVTFKVVGRHATTVAWAGVLPAGTVMISPVKGSQPLVTATPATITRSVSFLSAQRVHHVTTTTSHPYVTPTTLYHPATTTTIKRHRRPPATTTTTVAPTTTTTSAAFATTTTLGTVSSGSHFKSYWWILIIIFLILLFLLARRTFERR
jgi:hypothetical protein